ncbi:hypothetical protein, partial [Streptococcus pneumoniae]|uniref:hypothetical protein n=1 Tax=Streptococcus pneumoniae TaxID=1313 RepID=UPI0034533C5A
SGFLFIFQLPAINGLRDISHTSFFNLFSILFYHNYTQLANLTRISSLLAWINPSRDPWHF